MAGGNQIITKGISLVTKYSGDATRVASTASSDVARCGKRSLLVTNPVRIKLNLKELKLAQEVPQDSIKISEKAQFIKKLSEKFGQSDIRLKMDDTVDTFTCFEGSQSGSNPAFWAKNQRTGELFYIKYPCYKDDSKHIESEFLANKLYNLAGVQTADVKLVYMSGNKVCLASKFQEGLKPLNMQEAQRAFAVDAWLANWDGVLSENTMSVGGSCLKIDCGGSLRYRAMGGLKPQFGDQVDELLTLLSHKNSGSASVYHNMSRETAINSLKKVAQVSDESILQLVKDKDLANTLINRKKYITEFLEELQKKSDSKNSLQKDFQIIANDLKNKSQNGVLTSSNLMNEVKRCVTDLNSFPSTDYISKYLLSQIKSIEKQGGNITREGLLDLFEQMASSKLTLKRVSNEQRELYQRMFLRLKELAEKTPLEEGESLSKYFSKLEKLRKKRVKQLESGRLSFIKSRLQYDNTPEVIKPATLTKEQRELAIEELEETRVKWEKSFEIFLLPKLNPNATDQEIFEAWRAAHVANHTLDDSNLEKAIMAIGGRYNSSLNQKRITRFEEVMSNSYKQEFKYEPTYRWMAIDDVDKYIKSLPKRGEIYTFSSKQCCSTNKHYAEIDFNDDNAYMNVKLVMHPKNQTSKAYLLGTDNEVVYPKGQQFRIIDKDLVEYINPQTNMGCVRYEVHLQEI